ncbi:hypothetical protein SDC9_50335 [bioreactor metagenome]|uniref:DUF1836 domain-containing protein n=1 Tax=bioreactor metagenome TaxID=1076179 RepID=A0A644WJJ5_9ZZZZ
MEHLDTLKQQLKTERPIPWDLLPDINLYMDQVLSYLPRQLIAFDEKEKLTSAMVNNYSKEKLLPRAQGKHYTRDHLAHLTAISALKQVLSVKEIQTLLTALGEGRDARKLYEEFCTVLDGALSGTADRLSEDVETPEALATLALTLALDSYAARLACTRLLTLLEPPASKKEKGK